MNALERRDRLGLYQVRGISRRAVALTIDDGPTRRTAEILDRLAVAGAKATFFVHTDQVTDDGIIGRMTGEGHEIANHMPEARTSMFLGPERFPLEFDRAHRRLLELGIRPRLFRAAGGVFNAAWMLPSLRRHGYLERFIMASFLPWDVTIGLPQIYAQQLVRGAFPGAILVLHDGENGRRGRFEGTLRTLDALLVGLKQRGYAVETLGALLRETEGPP